MRTSFNVLPDGTLNYLNDRSAQNTDVYTLKGEGVETWHPRFRGNATRWVQVEGFPGNANEGQLRRTCHSHRPRARGRIRLFERADQSGLSATPAGAPVCRTAACRWSRIATSACRGRVIPAKTSESEGWAFNVARFYEHFLHNYRVHQAEDGSLQEILPPYWLFNSKDIIWPSVVTIIPDWYYNFYGDDRLLRDNYDMMKRFVLYHEQHESEAR